MSNRIVRAVVVLFLVVLSRAIAQTNGPLPRAFVTPDSVTDSLPAGGTSEHPLSIANLGDAPLDFSIALSDGTPPAFDVLHPAGAGYGDVTSAAAGDLDGDGDTDIVAMPYLSGRADWWENLDGDGKQWMQHVIDTNGLHSGDTVRIADVDGDGDSDVIGISKSRQVMWWENSDGRGRQWTRHVVYTELHFGRDLDGADLDGDGDMDLVAAGYHTPGILCFVNKDGRGTQWETRTVGTIYAGMSVSVADMDRDGDPDVLASGINEITWWENTSGNAAAWVAHPVKNVFEYTGWVEPADMDMDGDLDIVSVSYGSDEYAWWENTDGRGRSWLKKPVIKKVNDRYSRGAAQGLAIVDFDGDGDPDVLGSSRLTYDIWWWENLGAGAAWTEHKLHIWDHIPVNEFSSTPADISTGDLDGDGDPDILRAFWTSGEIGWLENETAPPWMRVAPRAGSVTTGCQTQVTLQLDATDLPAGCVVSGRATFVCNDPLSPITHIPVVLNVLETNPPRTTIAITPPANEHGWHNTNVSVALVATDEESGVASIRYVLNGTPTVVPGERADFGITDEGRHVLMYGATDLAGNEEPMHDAGVWLDRTPPELTLTLVRRAANQDRCQLLFRVTDDLSGVESAEAGLKTPDIRGYTVRLNEAPTLVILVDTKKRDVKIHAPDPNVVLEQLRDGLFHLASGQDLKLRLSPGSKHWRIWRAGRTLNVEAPRIAFTAAANDYAHNFAEARVSLGQDARKPAFLGLLRALGLARTL